MEKPMRIRARHALVLAGVGVGVGGSALMGMSAGPAKTVVRAAASLDSAAPVPATNKCTTVGAATDEHFDVSPSAGSMTLCLTRAGSPPTVTTTVWANGAKVAGYSDTACSWPNAGKGVFGQTVTVPGGATVLWGVAPSTATGVQITMASGQQTTAPIVGARPDYPEALFAAVVTSSPVGPLNATGPVGDQTRQAVTAC